MGREKIEELKRRVDERYHEAVGTGNTHDRDDFKWTVSRDTLQEIVGPSAVHDLETLFAGSGYHKYD